MTALWKTLKLSLLLLIMNIPLTIGAMGSQEGTTDAPPSYATIMASVPREPEQAVLALSPAVPMDKTVINAWMEEQAARVRKTTCSDALTRTACLHNCWLNMRNKPLADDGLIPPSLQQDATVTTMATRIRSLGCCKITGHTLCCCATCCQKPPRADDPEGMLNAIISRLNCCNVCCSTAGICMSSTGDLCVHHCLCKEDGCCGTIGDCCTHHCSCKEDGCCGAVSDCCTHHCSCKEDGYCGTIGDCCKNSCDCLGNCCNHHCSCKEDGCCGSIGDCCIKSCTICFGITFYCAHGCKM